MKDKMLDIVVTAYAKECITRRNMYKLSETEDESIKNLYERLYNESCERYWCLYRLLNGYGYTIDELYDMEIAALERK